MTTIPMNASKMLSGKLARLFNKEELVEILGLAEEKDEDFWNTQKLTVVARFYAYLQNHLGIPFTDERDTLSDEKLAHMSLIAEHFMQNGLTYKVVRTWWLEEGVYLHKKQYTVKHEQERADSLCIKALFFFEGEQPRFLGYTHVVDVETNPLGLEGPESLTPTRMATLFPANEEDKAHAFPVYSITELSKQSLLEQARAFESLRKKFGAKEVKLIVRNKPASAEA